MKNNNPLVLLVVGIFGINLLWVVGAFIYAKINLPDGKSVRCVGLWKTSNRRVYFTESIERALENPNREICRGGKIYSVEIWSASIDKNDAASSNQVNKFSLNDISRAGDLKNISTIPEGGSVEPKIDISKMSRW
jgi:hypothetical protein